MRPMLCLILLAGCASAQDIPGHPDKLKYKPLDFKVPDPASIRVELACGTVAYLLEDPALPLVDLQVIVRAGGFWEPKGKEGLASFAGSLMRTGGTKTRAPEALDEEIDFLAAEIGVSLGETHGTASLSVLSRNLDKGLEILADILRNPEFRQDKLDVLKAQALDRMKARNDSTASIEGREASLLFYGDFPVTRMSTRASIDSIARADLVAYHAEHFYPGNFMVAAAGAFKKDEFARKLDALFKGWKGGERKALPIPKVTHAPKPGIYCFHKEGKNINQGRVTIGHMGVDIHNPDIHALRLMSYIYGAGGFSSRLMQKVRTEEGLAYSVGSDFRPGTLYPAPFRILFQSKSESCAYAAKLCLDELDKLQKEGVREQELKDAVQFYLDGFPALFFATKIQTASTFALAELQGIPKDYYQTYREKLAKLTPADLQRVAREYLKPDKFVWIVVGDVPAIKRGDGKHPVGLPDLGPITDVPLPDPFTLERPKP